MRHTCLVESFLEALAEMTLELAFGARFDPHLDANGEVVIREVPSPANLWWVCDAVAPLWISAGGFRGRGGYIHGTVDIRLLRHADLHQEHGTHSDGHDSCRCLAQKSW
jgi:hypothetical protein